MGFFTGGGASAGVSLGSLRGIPLEVHWSFFAIWLIQCVFALIQHATVFKYFAMVFFVYGPILLVSVLLHEIGHCVANHLSGGTCEGITLWPFGGLSKLVLPDGTVMDEIKVSVSGPLMHIPSIIFWLIIMVASAPDRQGMSYEFDIAMFKDGGADEWFAALSQMSMSFNVLLLALNLLLPVYPLDAARILAAACVKCGATIVGAAYVVAIAGVCLGLGLLGYGIGMFASGGSNGVTFFFLGILALVGSGQLLVSLRAEMVHTHPLFAPECYRNPKGGRRPAQPDMVHGNDWVTNDQPRRDAPPPIRSLEFEDNIESPPEQPRPEKKSGNGGKGGKKSSAGNKGKSGKGKSDKGNGGKSKKKSGGNK